MGCECEYYHRLTLFQSQFPSLGKEMRQRGASRGFCTHRPHPHPRGNKCEMSKGQRSCDCALTTRPLLLFPPRSSEVHADESAQLCRRREEVQPLQSSNRKLPKCFLLMNNSEVKRIFCSCVQSTSVLFFLFSFAS